MSEASVAARAAMKSKAERLVRTDPKARVDSSGYTPPDALDADTKTGTRPVSRRQFKAGGAAVRRADRKPRKSGGAAPLTPDNYLNRDVREANQDRDGIKHVGGFKRGGHADEAQDRKMLHDMGCKCAKCMGGRAARKDGGKSEGKNWIAGAVGKPGALHKSLHVPKGQKIPEKKLEKAEHSDNPKLAKRARLAETLKGLPHKASGGTTGSNLHPVMEAALAPFTRGLPKRTAGEEALLKDQHLSPHDLARQRKAMRETEFSDDSRIGSSKATGGPVGKPTVLDGTYDTKGGRCARKSGGRTKAVNVNIVIAGKPGGPPAQPPMMPPRPMGAAPTPPVPPQVAAQLAAAAQQRGMGGPPGMPPGAPPMSRKRGGRTSYPLEAGGGSGLGRLEKIKAYGERPRKGASTGDTV